MMVLIPKVLKKLFRVEKLILFLFGGLALASPDLPVRYEKNVEDYNKPDYSNFF